MNKFFSLLILISSLFAQYDLSKLPDNFGQVERDFLVKYISKKPNFSNPYDELSMDYFEYNTVMIGIMIDHKDYEGLETVVNIIMAHNTIIDALSIRSQGYEKESSSEFENTMIFLSNIENHSIIEESMPTIIEQYAEALSFTIILASTLYPNFRIENTFLKDHVEYVINISQSSIDSSKWNEDGYILDNINFSLAIVKAMEEYADFSQSDSTFSSFEKDEQAIREIFKSVNDSDFVESLIDSYLSSVMPYYAWKEGSDKYISKMLAPSKRMIEEYPKDPRGYLNYLDTLDIVGSNLMDKEDKDTSKESYSNNVKEFIKMYQKVRKEAFDNIFENITVKDIQENPKYFSLHMRLAKLFAYTQPEPEQDSCINIDYAECRFNHILGEILTIDKINNILMEKDKEQLYLDYQRGISGNEISIVTENLLNTYKNIIIYQISHDGNKYDHDMKVYFITVEPDKDGFPFLEINQYYSNMNGEFFDENFTLLSKSDLNVESFFYNDEGVLIFEERIKLFEDALSSNIEAGMYESSTMFYEILIRGIKEEHKDLGIDLVIIPDPSITNIPFELLTDHNDDIMILSNHFITYSNSLYQYHQDMESWSLKWGGSQDESDEEFEKRVKSWVPIIVAFGDIEYDSIDQSFIKKMGFSSLKKLNWSDEEMDSIQSQFKNSNSVFYRGKNASETSLKTIDFTSIDFLHFSTHGLSLHDNHEQSSIVFDSDSSNDGFLTYKEILKLDLSNLEFVFLSACSTNKGQDFRNINLLSLQKAFKSAGARNVLSTLWDIDDKATSIFTSIYYKNLKDYPMYPDMALSFTKEEFMEKYPHPHKYNSAHYWSAFVNYGY